MQLLMICTANQCRSPIAAALTSTRLEATGMTGVDVRSGGLLPGGYGMPDPGVRQMQGRGIDLSGHVSRQVDAASAAEADLILGMAREHVRQLVADRPDRYARCFTLKDFVRRAESLPPAEAEPWIGWIARVGVDRDRRQLLGAAVADDVNDPMGRSADVWSGVIAVLDEWTRRLATVLRRLSELP